MIEEAAYLVYSRGTRVKVVPVKGRKRSDWVHVGQVSTGLVYATKTFYAKKKQGCMSFGKNEQEAGLWAVISTIAAVTTYYPNGCLDKSKVELRV